MSQATNELIIGIELHKQGSQMTYYHASVKEPMTLDTGRDPEQFRMPMALRKDRDGVWHFWDAGNAAEADPSDLAQIPDIDAILQQESPVQTKEQSFAPEEVMAIYFRLCFDRLRFLTQQATICVMVTVRELTESCSEVLVQALERNGLDRRQIYLQDYLSSFYYYTVNQRRELWYQDVALLEYENEAINGYILHIDRTTRPAIASAQLIVRQPMGEAVRAGRNDQEWNREKDRLFFELLKKLFERRTVSASYLMGSYFDRSWAERSIQYLCYRRHAFQGENLYSKGACYAAMEREGMLPGRDIMFGGRDMVEHNISMEMRIRGKDTFYPMVTAGINWYEVHHVCEFILNDEREIRVISHPMAQGETVVHMMRLTGLPPRPKRATRVRLTLYFSSPRRCHMEVEDLGFGGFYKPSGLIWTRTLDF